MGDCEPPSDAYRPLESRSSPHKRSKPEESFAKSIQGGSTDSPEFDAALILDKPIPITSMSVVFDEKFDAKTPADEDDQEILATWKERLKRNPLLFDGMKFRLADFKVDASHVTLHLGLTSYARFLGTNRNANVAFLSSLEKKGLDLHNDAAAFMSNPFGNAALVLTADGCIPLIRRSLKTAEFAGWFDVPGGHPEPHRVGVNNFKHRITDANEIVKELFYAITDEIHTELNLPKDRLEEPLFFGIVKHCASRGRAGAVL